MDAMEALSQSFVLDAPGMKKFSRWVLENVLPYIKDRSLEINSGRGLFADLMVETQIEVHLSDPQQSKCLDLRSKFADIGYIRAIHHIDIYNSDINQAKSRLLKVFDTVIAVNVPEYGHFTKSTIENFQVLLKPGGRLIIIVPAFTSIYSGLEENLDEWKLFNQKALIKHVNKNFSIMKTRYMNLMAEAGADLQPQLGLSILAVLRKI